MSTDFAIANTAFSYHLVRSAEEVNCPSGVQPVFGEASGDDVSHCTGHRAKAGSGATSAFAPIGKLNWKGFRRIRAQNFVS